MARAMSSLGSKDQTLVRSVPSVHQFFRYQPGDIVQFARSSTSNNHSSSSQERFHIEQLTDLPGRLEFTGYSYSRYVGEYGAIYYSYSPTRDWVIDITASTLRPMVTAPDELVTLGGNSGSSAYPSMICKHRINANGFYVIQAESFGSTSMFYLPDTISGECIAAFIPIGYPSSYILDTQLGLRYYGIGNGPSSSSSWIAGAVINGDTIGTVSSDEYFHVPVDEDDPPVVEDPEIVLCPNPSMDWVQLPEGFNDKELLIFDLQGRLVQTLRLAEAALLDVRTLPEGVYLLSADGVDPQRLVIAR